MLPYTNFSPNGLFFQNKITSLAWWNEFGQMNGAYIVGKAEMLLHTFFSREIQARFKSIHCTFFTI